MGNTVPGNSFAYTSPPGIRSHGVFGLTPETDYDIYVVLKDSVGNLQAVPARMDVTTLPDIDTVPNDANSGITGQVRGPDGSKKVTLTVTVRNAAGEAITGIGPGYFEVSVDNGPAQRFDLSSLFSDFSDKGDGTYTVVFTEAADNTSYTFTNLTVHGVVIEAGPTIVTTPPVADNGSNGSSGSSGGRTPAKQTFNADVSGISAAGTTLPVTFNTDTGNAAADLGTLAGEIFAVEETTVITMPSIPGVNDYTVGLHASSLSDTQGKGALTLSTNAGSITIPADMLAGMSGTEGKKAGVTIGQGDKSGLSDDLQTAIGDRPLVQLTLTLNGKQTDWNNPDAPVTVSIPYTPTAEELANPESIVIWYIDGNGSAVSVSDGHYDPATGAVIFTTTHFSDYAVGYSKVSFSDVPAGAWYSKAVGFIAARGITEGTGGGNFSPEEKLTREQFIVMLMKAYGIAPDETAADNFSDAGDTWHTGYLAAAKRLGISNGVGNNMFAPAKEITHQEMFTLLYNALKVIGQLPQGDSGKALSDFTDAGLIDSWAKDAITLLVETGTISGNAGKLSPTGTTTRAEMAQVLYNLMSK